MAQLSLWQSWPNQAELGLVKGNADQVLFGRKGARCRECWGDKERRSDENRRGRKRKGQRWEEGWIVGEKKEA